MFEKVSVHSLALQNFPNESQIFFGALLETISVPGPYKSYYVYFILSSMHNY